jgi:filamentous hemagglutinin
LTIDRAGAPARRGESLAGRNKVPGKDLDEYPPAMFKEGGKGASVRPVTPRDNRGAGACIGNQCRDLPDGARVKIVVE